MTVNTAIKFCNKELIPHRDLIHHRETVKTIALYALGGFLSGRVFGFVSPMHGVMYLVASRITYVAINCISYYICKIASNTTSALSEKISIEPEYKNLDHLHGCLKKENFFSSFVKKSRCLVSSWMGSLRLGLNFIKGMPLDYTNIYLSHHMANITALSLLKMQPIAYRTAIKVVCSSTVLTIFASSFIGFATHQIKIRTIGKTGYY